MHFSLCIHPYFFSEYCTLHLSPSPASLLKSLACVFTIHPYFFSGILYTSLIFLACVSPFSFLSLSPPTVLLLLYIFFFTRFCRSGLSTSPRSAIKPPYKAKVAAENAWNVALPAVVFSLPLSCCHRGMLYYISSFFAFTFISLVQACFGRLHGC